MRLPTSIVALCLLGIGIASFGQESAEESVLVAPPLIAIDPAAISPDHATEPIEEVLPPPTGFAPLADESPADAPDGEAAAGLLASLVESHEWMRFEPGAWRRSRTLSDAFDAEGAFVGRSLTERTERLVAKDAAGYTLRIDTIVELSGRRTAGPSETVRRSVYCDRPVGDDAVSVRELEPTAVGIGGRAIPCRVWEVRWSTAAGTELQRVYVAEAGTLRVLRRETRAPADGEALATTESVVTLADAPVRVGDELTPGWHLESDSVRASGGVARSHEVHSPAAPGGVHQRVITEYDALGHRSRWAVEELVAWGRHAKETIDGDSRSVGEAPASPLEPGVRPRRLMRMLRRAERAAPAEGAP